MPNPCQASCGRARPPPARRGRREPVAAERGVRVDRVRHDRGAEDGCREQHRVGVGEARHEPAEHARGVGRATKTPTREADAMIDEQADDHELERAWSAPRLHHEQPERDAAGDEAAPQERHAEQQVEGDGPADDLGEVGGHRHEFGLQPVGAAAPAVADAPAEHLGQALAGHDAELRRQVLDEPGHDVAEHDDPDEQVAVLRARRHVARDVARVEVGDAGDEGGADQPGERGTPCAVAAQAAAVARRPVGHRGVGCDLAIESFRHTEILQYFGTPKSPIAVSLERGHMALRRQSGGHVRAPRWLSCRARTTHPYVLYLRWVEAGRPSPDDYERGAGGLLVGAPDSSRSTMR